MATQLTCDMLYAMFSVVIPTLQRSAQLGPLVEQCCAHPLVAEVIVINNAVEPLSWPSPKVRVLPQRENIYVNPAWNLGAFEARSPWLAIINDDVKFEDEALDEAGKALRRNWFGIIGPAGSCFDSPVVGGPVTHRPVFEMGIHFGTFMCLRKANFVPIPPDLLIWGGDDWLFWHQRRPNAVLLNTRFVTQMGTTSTSPEFDAQRRQEREDYIPEVKGSYWWHHIAPLSRRMRRL